MIEPQQEPQPLTFEDLKFVEAKIKQLHEEFDLSEDTYIEVINKIRFKRRELKVISSKLQCSNNKVCNPKSKQQ